MAANGISSLSTKEARQLAKLELAQTKRQAAGDTSLPYYRQNNVYDINTLPTKYSGNTVVDNPNASGLIVGRPWVNIANITFASNIYYYNRVGTNTANGYFAENVTFFNNTVVSPAVETQGTYTTINISNQPQFNSIMLLGYLKAPATATFTFYTASDDASYLWIGPTAITGYTTANAIVKNGGLHAVTEASGTASLIQNVYYPIRIMFGNNSGPGALTVSYSTPSITKTSNWTGLIFHNADTNGF